MNYNETLNYIHSLGKFRLLATLDRIKKVCESFNNPQDKFKSIHIAGTNGKGSTATMTANALINAGYKTGLFISPFVVDFRERIEINGEYISENDLIKYADKIIKTKIKLNEFEFITAVAFLYFAEQDIDIAVFETGLGGRLDATNILKNVLVSVITKIGLDHTAILGDTIEKITAEKCGIIKENVPVVTVCNQDKQALAVIKTYTNNLTVPKMPEIVKADISGSEFIYENKKYNLSLIGTHQIFNAVTVIETLKNSKLNVNEKCVKKAISETTFSVRLEIVSRNPLTVIDGAHNIDGAKALSEFLRGQTQKVTVICAMMKDKAYEDFVKEISPFADTFIATEIENERCLKAEALFETASKYVKNAVCKKDINSAIKYANSIKKPIFIVGSLYLAGKARKYYNK